MNGYWPAYSPQEKLTRFESSIHGRAFWEIIFGSVDVLPVYRFLQKYFWMIAKLNDYVTFGDDDDADFRHNHRENVIAQYKQDL